MAYNLSHPDDPGRGQSDLETPADLDEIEASEERARLGAIGDLATEIRFQEQRLRDLRAEQRRMKPRNPNVPGGR